jgi:hypothetical protein
MFLKQREMVSVKLSKVLILSLSPLVFLENQA